MPGKVNPVMPEMVIQVAAQVIGNDTAITNGGQGGIFGIERNAAIDRVESVALNQPVGKSNPAFRGKVRG